MNLAETDLQVKVKRRPRDVTFHIEGKAIRLTSNDAGLADALRLSAAR